MSKTSKSRGKKAGKTGKLSLLSIFSLLLCLGLAGAVAWRVHKNPISLSPLPYKISGSPEQTSLDKASSTQVLFVGDRMAVQIDQYMPAFIESASRNITEPIKVYNFAGDGKGLHRTVAELKLLKKMPPLIIYYGASQEFFETRAHPVQYKTFLRNKEIQSQEILSSLLMAWPRVSQVLYEPYNFFKFDLAAPPTDKVKIGPGPGKLEQMEMLFQIFEWELEEIVRISKASGSKLIFITNPINLDVAPLAACSYSEDSSIRSSLSQQAQLMKNGKSKEAFDNLKVLTEKSVANSKAHYLYAKAAESMGKISIAKKSLVKAAAVDCGTWRGSPIFNEIIRKVADRNGVPLVDYDGQLNAMYGQNVLFFDEINPQNVFNRAMMSKLGELTARLLDL
tara:strand:+ start:6213 stop:7394 length:1182 start_codon:yes stop_codon:yes gene_type:complete